ncbi:unnamed protein product [Paramecium octaurelia]|uniref:Transmembrane protein n=1 Tax=Paramecium octaurelia TaxID=43137 RepID=A0A8S1WFI0_PAROT|nr:unnamed protein product [Paramecium octaurelia]
MHFQRIQVLTQNSQLRIILKIEWMQQKQQILKFSFLQTLMYQFKNKRCKKIGKRMDFNKKNIVFVLLNLLNIGTIAVELMYSNSQYNVSLNKPIAFLCIDLSALRYIIKYLFVQLLDQVHGIIINSLQQRNLIIGKKKVQNLFARSILIEIFDCVFLQIFRQLNFSKHPQVCFVANCFA